MSISRRAAAAAVSTLALLGASSAWAETLTDAIALAYASNPTLQEQRARLRSLDESYVQARQGFRPEATLQGSVGYDQVNAGSGQGRQTQFGYQTADTESNSAGAQLNVSQPLYTGGRVSNALRTAEANILVGRENLRSIEQSVLLTVIQAYSDVLRDTESLRIREENVGVLRRQLEEAQARFEVGEITRTDVAQSEARLAAAQALLAQAPDAWVAHLAPGGRLGVVERHGPLGKAQLYARSLNGSIARRTTFDSTPPFIKGFEPKAGFVF